MLSRLLLCLYATEFALYFLLWSSGRLPAAAAAAIALVWRLILCANAFRTSERCKSPRPPAMEIGAAAWVRLIAAEYASFLAIYLFLHPFPMLFAPRGPRPLHAGGTHILLIHGYLCNGGFWWSMRRFLARNGVTQTHVIHCEPTFGSIDAFADQAAARIGDICARTGAEKIVLVGHSMGGLIARRCVQKYGPAGVATIVTLGSPHHGTVVAKTGIGIDARQMTPGNPWLDALNATPDPVPVVSIWSHHDNIVAPQASSVLPGAHNIPLAGIGHLEMAFSPRIQQLVLDAVETASRDDSAQRAR